MWLNYNTPNTFIAWAKSQKLKIDISQYEARKQFLEFEEIEAKQYCHPEDIAETNKEIISVSEDILKDDKAQAQFAKRCIPTIKILSKFPASFKWQEKAFYYTCDKAGSNVFDNMAMSFILKNIETYNVIIDRNTETGYLITTPAAWENFKKFYEGNLKTLETEEAEAANKCRIANEQHLEALKKFEEAKGNYMVAEKNHFYNKCFQEVFEKM